MIPFANYMERILYGPAGYYSAGTAKSGKTGDYFTAPDVGPVFGQLLAEIFLSWRSRLAADSFDLIEAGAGEGRLAKDILAAWPREGFPVRYRAIERSPVRRSFLKRIKSETP